MTDDQDTLELATEDLAAARGRIDEARAALQRALDAGAGDVAPVRQALARLERIAAEVARVARVCAAQMAAATEAVR